MITLQHKDLQYSLDERETFFLSMKEFPEKHVLLHTCNRVEIYIGDGEVPTKIARHLFRVVSGLESALLGENTIQGQIKQAYQQAMQNNSISTGLHKLFQNALRIGKRVRTETRISHGAMSHSLAVLEILKQNRVDLTKSRFMIIGINNLNITVIKYLVKKGINTIFVANRTYEKARQLSKKFGCEAIKFDRFYENLAATNILISATSAPHLILKKDKFQMKQKMIIFDLAVPRDVDPAIGRYSYVQLLNVEDIEKIIKQNKRNRLKELKLAQQIIEEETQKFMLGN
jgi:glutamyl-tRNA reductase